MTLEEKRKAIKEHCINKWKDGNCVGCPLYSVTGACYEDDKLVDEKYEILFGKSKEEVTQLDMVNHPPHYTQDGIECIDEMIMVFGEATVMDFCLCNVWKYRKRALHKNGQEDLDKANWYMKKYKELLENGK